MSLRKKICVVLFILIGTIIQVIPTIRSGLSYSYGIGYWGPSGHDSVWHLSLINHIKNPFSIPLPIYSGQRLVNYHPFYDICIAFLALITNIPSNYWLFQIFPIISSIVFLYLSFKLGQLITKSFSGGLILLALNTLANSFGWLVNLIRFNNFSGESLFWAMQSPSNQINPPYQLSLIFILILLIILFKNQNNPKLSLKNYATILLLLILLPITKAYSAIVGFSLFGLFALFTSYRFKSYYNLGFFIISTLLSALIFLHFNPNTSSLLVFNPFWFINSMIESPDRLYIPQLANIRYAASQTNNIPKLFFATSVSFILFIIGNYSWRLLGFTEILKRPSLFKFSLFFNIIVLTLIPTLFIQKGTGWNTIQFLYYALFLSNIYFAQYLNKSKVLILIVFFSYTLAFYGNLENYLGKIPPASLPKAEKLALDFLAQQPSGIVLTVPFDPYLKNSFTQTPIPLYAYETTAYVSAYAKKFTYLEDEMNLNNSGYDFSSRHQLSTNFFQQKNIFQDRGFLVNNQISYIYLAGIQQDKYPLSNPSLSLKQIFKNSDATIYLVQR